MRPWGILAIAAALALSGCSVQHADSMDGSGTPAPTQTLGDPAAPLAFAGGQTDTCADGSAHRAFVFGIPVTNSSDDGVYVTGSGFDSNGLELLGIWLVSGDKGDDTVSATTWTADYPIVETDIVDWDSRVEISDVPAIPAQTSAWVAVALQLSDGAASGTAKNLTLDYRGPDGVGTVRDPSSVAIGRVVDGELSCAP